MHENIYNISYIIPNYCYVFLICMFVFSPSLCARTQTFALVVPLRKCLRDSDVKVTAWGGTRILHVFLFNDMMLFSKTVRGKWWLFFVCFLVVFCLFLFVCFCLFFVLFCFVCFFPSVLVCLLFFVVFFCFVFMCACVLMAYICFCRLLFLMFLCV